MRWLIWKEFRLHWPILLLGCFLWLFPFLVTWWVSAFVAGDSLRTMVVGPEFTGACQGSAYMGLFALTLLAANSIAGERADRSVEFLAYQPIPKVKHVISKLFLPCLTAIAIWGGNGLLLYIHRRLSYRQPPYDLLLVIPVAVGTLSFSVAWLVSTLQDSPAYAVFSGLLAPFIVTLGVLALARLGVPFELYTIVIVMPVLAVVCFVGGTWYYVWRVEP